MVVWECGFHAKEMGTEAEMMEGENILVGSELVEMQVRPLLKTDCSASEAGSSGEW